ncbi:hypothetical protein [Nonomuraea sp. JJY05]|uniref:hypothetical protein n=1 Tax=Nonomuraea sp. JJY05 TaxID=3350255 RepID=UPI00373E4E77
MLEPELAAELPLEAPGRAGRQRLAAHEGWLLVLEDVTSPADVAPLLGRMLARRSTRRVPIWARPG